MTYIDGTAQRLCEIALAEIGYIETPDNITKYGEHTKANGLPWCGSFVNWCAHHAGVKLPSMVSTAMGAQRMKDVARWHTENPQAGDLAFFDFPSDGVDRISHIGIVVAIAGKEVITVEGNTAPSGGDQRNGGMVMLKTRAYGKGSPIVGFARPKYSVSILAYPEVKASEEAASKVKKKGKKNDTSEANTGIMGKIISSGKSGGLSRRAE